MAPSPPQPQELSLADLRALSVLGQGARGVVFHVVPATAAAAAAGAAGEPMALKAMSRAAARQKGGDDDGHRRIWFERDVLLSLRHPLLPSLRGVVATDAVVGFAISRCPGGDLKSLIRHRRWHWRTRTTFPESVIRFYAAELVLALEHLHGLGVVYRDLKPENVLIQDSGHIMLVDFDLSTTLPLPPAPPPHPPDTTTTPPRATSHSPHFHRRSKNNKTKAAMLFGACFSSRHDAHDAASSSPETTTTTTTTTTTSSQSSSQTTTSTSSTTTTTASSKSCCSPPATKSNSFVGTEDYVAPEMVAGAGHDYAVDWWGLGVVVYEMLYGRTPFRGRSRRETFHRVLTAPPPELQLAAGEAPPSPSPPLRDLIGRLLEKDPRKRLVGARGVKRHAFFRGVDWDRVLHVARPPFIPPPDQNDVVEAVALDVEKVVREVFGGSSGGAGETTRLVVEDCSDDGGTDGDFSVFF